MVWVRNPMAKAMLALGVMGLLWLAAGATMQAGAPQVVQLRAWTVGPDTPAYYRAENLKLAAARLNKFLEDTGAAVRVQVDADFWTESWDSYRRRNILAFQEGKPDVVADIVLSSHLDVPVWAEGGWIIPLDRYIERYWDMTYQDFFPHLWESVTYKGQRWAVPQDIEVRMVWYRKDKLRALGWSEADIADLPRRVRDGEFTLNDLADLARRMKAAGLVEWGALHRPTAGPDFFQFVVAFGGQYFDAASGKLVLERQAMRSALDFFHRLARVDRVLPEGMTTWSWPAVHRSIAVDGTAGMQITGGMWNWAEWQRDFKVPEEQLWETITFSLIPRGAPGGRANQLGHPLAYMVSSASRYKELAFLLITLASAVDLNTNHALTGAKLAIRRSQTAFAPFAQARFPAAAATLLPQQIFMPPHPGSGLYSSVFHEAIGAVETGALSPAAAVDMMASRLQRELRDQILVR